jgi:hypothetical protein
MKLRYTIKNGSVSAQRLILAGGFAIAVAAAPAIAIVAASTDSPAAPVAQCASGEEADVFTGVCVPHTVPRSPFSPIPGSAWCQGVS